MPFWKLAALLALASIPLLLLSNTEESRKPVRQPIADDEDNIFERELTAD